MAAARLYTGPAYTPINAALRTENVAAWATTIACLYSAVLKLSFLSKPARVYRGVKEDTRKLSDKFLNAATDDFAGGVEVRPQRPPEPAAIASASTRCWPFGLPV